MATLGHDGVGQGSLAVVNVGDDGDVADFHSRIGINKLLTIKEVQLKHY
jgi:hypothetical protein